jgi:hypothetical protein
MTLPFLLRPGNQTDLQVGEGGWWACCGTSRGCDYLGTSCTVSGCPQTCPCPAPSHPPCTPDFQQGHIPPPACPPLSQCGPACTAPPSCSPSWSTACWGILNPGCCCVYHARLHHSDLALVAPLLLVLLLFLWSTTTLLSSFPWKVSNTEAQALLSSLSNSSTTFLSPCHSSSSSASCSAQP